MPLKRRNHGRGKMHAGRIQYVNCLNCGKLVPKDKAIKRFATKNMVETSAAKDILDACIFKDYSIPKLYQKTFYCVSCAVHRRVVRVRNVNSRRERVPLFMKLREEKMAQHPAKKQNRKPTEQQAAPAANTEAQQ